METSKYLSKENKREAILDILSSSDNSTAMLSRLKAVDLNWSSLVRGDEEEKTPGSDNMSRRKETKKAKSSEPTKLRQSKPKILNPIATTNRRQVQIRWGVVITRLPTSIGAMDRGEELLEKLKNLKCPDHLYEICLDEAYRRDWPGFSCVNCKNFR